MFRPKFCGFAALDVLRLSSLKTECDAAKQIQDCDTSNAGSLEECLTRGYHSKLRLLPKHTRDRLRTVHQQDQMPRKQFRLICLRLFT
jgi:hypothetical protein